MMTRTDIINRTKNYFKIYELVSREVYHKYGEDAWALFHTDAIHCLLLIREGIDKPITVNDWYWDGYFDERGYRENTCSICKKKTENGVIYTSGHVLGMAFDFHIDTMSADLIREWIVENEDIFPCKVRLERNLNGEPITWVHIDIKYYERNPKVYLFDV